MAEQTRELTLKLNLKNTVTPELNKIIEDMRGLERTAEKTKSGLNDAEEGLKDVGDSADKATKATVQFEGKVLAANTAANRAATSFAKASDAVDELSKMADHAESIMRQFEEELNDVDRKASQNMFGKMIDGLQDMGQAASKAGKKISESMKDIRSDLNDAGKFAIGNLVSDGMQAATSAVIEFGKESVGVYLDFENTMIGVAKASGLPTEQLDLLATQLQDVAQAIGPATAQDMAEVAEAAARMGVGAGKLKEAEMALQMGKTAEAAQLFAQARDEIVEFSESIGVANVALKDFPGGAEGIATSIAKILALYGQSSGYAEQYLSVINRLDDTMAATAPQIVGFLEGFTSANSQWKMSQEQAAAYGATLVSLGQDPHDAATRLQSALTFLNRSNMEAEMAFKKLAKTSPEFVNSLSDITKVSLTTASSGEDIQNAYRKLMDTDLDKALMLVSEALGSVDSATERNTLSVKLYGAVGARAMGGLSGSYADLVVGAEDAAAAFLDTEQGLSGLEKATGMVRTEFGTTSDFIAAAFKEKPVAAISALVEEVQKIPDEATRVQTATELFGEKFGKSMAEGAKNGVQQLKESLDVSAEDVKRYTETSVSSLDKEMKRVLESNQATFDELGGSLEKLQLIIGKDIVDALGSVIKTDLTPMLNNFSNWVKTSEEARTLFETTLPGALKMTVEVAKGVTTFLTTIHNTIVGIAEITGRLVDATSQVIGSQQELGGEFKEQAAVIGDYNAQVAQNLTQVAKYEQVVPQMQGMTVATEEMSEAAKAYNGFLLDANYDTLLTSLNEVYGANQNLLVGNTAVENSMNTVFTALRDGTAPTAELESQFTRLVAQFQAAGVSTDELKNAFPSLAAGIGTTAASTKDMGVVMESLPLVDVAREAMAVSEGMKAVTEVNKQQAESAKAAAQAMTEEGQAAKGTYAALKEISGSHREAIAGNRDLSQSYVAVAREMESAMNGTTEPTESLIRSTERLVTQLQAAGVNTAPLVQQLNALGKATMGADYAFEGGSLTPALRRYIIAALDSNASTGQLSASMVTSMQSVLKADDAFTQLESTMASNKTEIGRIDMAVNDLENRLASAGKEERAGIQETIREYQNKRRTLQNEQIDLGQKKKLLEDAIDTEVVGIKEAQKAAEDAAKAKAKTEEELAKNSENTAKLRQKNIEAEQKAENEAYKERQKAAADSVKWVSQLDDATKKRILGEKDAVAVLKAQGVELTTLQEQEIRRMQGAYKTEQAYEAQAKALAAQLDPMGTLIAAGEQLSGSLGDLSSGIGNIGDLFNIDTSGIENAISKIQQIADLPQKIGGVIERVKGIGSAVTDVLGGLGSVGSAITGGLGSVGSAVSGVLGGLGGLGGAIGGIVAAAGPFALAGGVIFAAWKGISALLQDTKSKGTEAAEAFQDFVAKNVSGGEEMASAMGTAFDTMTANNFDFQASLNASGSTMSQVMGGISANWQQGSTAMDIFTQAVGRATGDMQKAPQVALQMTMGMDAMGLSAEQAGIKMLEVAEKAGMSSAEIEKLKAALAAGGEEGASTTVVFDNATQAENDLIAKTVDLSGKVGGLTRQLSGAGDEGGDTAAVFRTASGAASDLSGRTDQLSGQVRDLTNQMGSAGSSTIAASNIFGTASGSANNLSGNMDGLASMARAAGMDVDSLKRLLEALPAKKDVVVNVTTTGQVPQMARGGQIGRTGLAIVNELGSEIAKFPGGSMALMTARGPVLGAFPVGTEIIPHDRAMRIVRENPTISRMATGGTIMANSANAGKPIVNNYFNYTVNLHASVIDRNTARVIDAELQRLHKQRAGV